MTRTLPSVILVASCLLTVSAVFADVDADADAPPARDEDVVDISDPLSNLELTTAEDGSLRVVVETQAGSRQLTGEQLLRQIRRQQQYQEEHGWLFVVLNITSPVGIAWVSLGLLGQVLFTGRMVVQWLVSEKEHRSTVPIMFWWMSLIGASMLIAYFMWRKDAVGILGQAGGWLIYLRNLWLIYKTGQNESKSISTA